MTVQDRALGALLRDWRRRRRMSQLDLALEAEISSRHLSFIETGRSAPSRDMVARLSASLDLPLRERNALLLAAGYAPDYPQHDFGDPSLAAARAAVERIVHCHMPFPALAVDRHWHLLCANPAVNGLIAGAAPELLEPPVNVLRLSLHPQGLAPAIVNLAEWKRHVLDRLVRQARVSGDPALDALVEELQALPAPASSGRADPGAAFIVPLLLDTPAGRLSLVSTTTMFGTPAEVTLSEIAIESFFPADEETAGKLRQLAG